MIKQLFTTFFVFSVLSLHAQFHEYTEDRGYNNKITNVLNVGDSLWVFSADYKFGTIGEGGAYVFATDTMGNKLWQHDVAGAFDNNTEILDIVLTPQEKILVFRALSIPCDLLSSSQLEILELDLTGEATSTTLHEIDLFWWNAVKDVRITDDQLVLASGTTSPSGEEIGYKVFGFDLSGSQLLWTTSWYEEEIDRIARYGDSVAVFSDDQLVILDVQGVRVDSLSYSAAPLDVATFRDSSLLLLWGNGFSELNSDFELQPVIDLDDDYTPNTILTRENVIYLWDGAELRMYNSDYELIELVNVDVLPYFSQLEVMVSGSSLTTVGSKRFEEVSFWSGSYYRCGTFAFYDLSNDTANYQTDVAVRHLEFTELNTDQINEDPILFNFTANVGGYVVNTGEEVLTSVNLNYMGDQSITCGIDYERLALNDIVILPGDSIYFTMEGLTRSFVHSSDGSGTISFCVFASEPSNLFDRDETNDLGCVSAAYGVGLEENQNFISAVFPNPASSRLNVTLPDMNEPAQLQFLDARGVLVSEEQVNRGTNLEFSVSDWPAGLYLARVVVVGKASAPVKFSVVK